MRTEELHRLATFIDRDKADFLRAKYGSWPEQCAQGAPLATLLVTAYPSFSVLADARPHLFSELMRDGWRAPRDRATLIARLFARVGPIHMADTVHAELRRAVQYEKLRIATRELLPPSLDGADVDVTSAEISHLAEASLEVALAEARFHVSARLGEPRAAHGGASTFVVLGMGKLGGGELNAGSDVDLLYLYDTDDGATVLGEGRESSSLHEFWSRVAKRLTSTIETATEDGAVWRVDLRLRPEGSRGAIANSLPAAERYYETFGRLWERAALLRAAPVAGDLALGREILGELAPFIYQRHVEPGVASEMINLAERAREELSPDPELDIKLGVGAIREAEFFVQSLQLIWGGREPRVRATGTLDALRRLRVRGLVTDREGREVADAYVFFRRIEHWVQWSTGLQTHQLPQPGEDRLRLARSLGYPTAEAFEAELGLCRLRVASLFASLSPTGPSKEPERFRPILIQLDSSEHDGLSEVVARQFGLSSGTELASDLRQLGRRPDSLLGVATRERFPGFATTLLEALSDAADPEQAARYLRGWEMRLGAPGAYVTPLAEDPRALRRLIAALGASAFIGSAIATRPELCDNVLFSRQVPSRQIAERQLAEEVSALSESDRRDPDSFVAALRRAKDRTTIEVALADLAGEMSTREATMTLSAIADATLEFATRFVLDSPGPVQGLSVIAVGKLGGNEIGYGSDLDVLFIFDPEASPPAVSAQEYFARRAPRIIRLLSAPHSEGPGYELDTRLRPSGSHGMLVTSLEAFATYHHVPFGQALSSPPPSVLSSGAAWERQALLRARFCAGDAALGRRVLDIAHVAAYENGAPPAAEIHRLRMRMQHELSHERQGRYDLKVGRGGLCDIEFAAQYLQMKHGRDARIRTSETPHALRMLECYGYLDSASTEVLLDGYRFLRMLEQRIRVVHGSAANLLDEGAEGLGPLSRRMGLRDSPRGSAKAQLMERYRDVTSSVRAAYLSIVGGTE